MIPVKQSTLSGWAWSEGKFVDVLAQPTVPDERRDHDFSHMQALLVKLLETMTHGKIVRTYEGGSMELYYRAATDSQRGRFIVTGLTPEEAEQALVERQKEYEVKCFTPRELYALKPVRVSHILHHFLSTHLRDEIDAWAIDTNKLEETKLIEIRDLADECEDGRRTWTLETIWFNGMPVMVVNSSGRDGDEYFNRYITDRQLFESMVSYIRTFSEPDSVEGVVDIDAVIPDMTEFYHATIHKYYDMKNQKRRNF